MPASRPGQPPILVSFSGIDGAGKSTQIENLHIRLKDAGLRVDLVTFWDDVATLKQIREGAGQKVFGGDPGVGSPEAPIERKDKNVRSPLMTMVRLGIYLLDAVSLRRAVGKALKSSADAIIFDRYIYDELANLNLNSSLMRFYVRGVMLLSPRPQISFIIDADPVQARARKPEYPLEFLHINRDSYLRLSRLVGDITVIPPMPLEQAKTAVAGHVLPLAFDACRRVPGDSPVGRNSEAQTQLDGHTARPVAS